MPFWAWWPRGSSTTRGCRWRSGSTSSCTRCLPRPALPTRSTAETEAGCSGRCWVIPGCRPSTASTWSNTAASRFPVRRPRNRSRTSADLIPAAMKILPERAVVIVGGGLAAGLIARQLVRQHVDTVVLERGGDHRQGAEGRIPTQRDELRWDVRSGLIQDAANETYTLRRSGTEQSRPMRRLSAFLPRTGGGGAGRHRGGRAWRRGGPN